VTAGNLAAFGVSIAVS